MANRPRKLGIRAKMTLIFGLAAVALALSPFLRPALAEHYSLTIDPQYQSSRVRQLISQLIDIANSDFKTLHYNSVNC
jgi:N-acetylglutamate synthase-like GNAT family acetyltransferase